MWTFLFVSGAVAFIVYRFKVELKEGYSYAVVPLLR